MLLNIYIHMYALLSPFSCVLLSLPYQSFVCLLFDSFESSTLSHFLLYALLLGNFIHNMIVIISFFNFYAALTSDFQTYLMSQTTCLINYNTQNFHKHLKTTGQFLLTPILFIYPNILYQLEISKENKAQTRNFNVGNLLVMENGYKVFR